MNSTQRPGTELRTRPRPSHEEPSPAIRASIIVDNFNYEQFLGQAVESALRQTHVNTEVIVVDDGSGDSSLEVLEKYGDQIKIVSKENGGQASCYRAGFAQSSGDVVLFLDADDYLRPDCIERVLHHWTSSVSKAHYYLSLINAEGALLGGRVPSGKLAGGEARAMMKLFGSYCAPPASGNVFNASFLKEIFPLMNDDALQYSADASMIFAAPFFGRIVAIPASLGYYRRHEKANTSSRLQLDLSASVELLRSEHQRDLLRDNSWRIAAQHFTPAPYHLLDPSRAKRRLCYLKLSGGDQLVRGDTRLSLLNQSVRALWRWSGYSFIQKIFATLWFFLVTLLPTRIASGLIKPALLFRSRTPWQIEFLR